MAWQDTLNAGIKAAAISDSLSYVDELGNLFTVKGVFTDEYQDDLGTQARRPQVYVDVSDLGGGEIIGTVWEYNGNQYYARTVERDGDGWAFIGLEKQ